MNKLFRKLPGISTAVTFITCLAVLTVLASGCSDNNKSSDTSSIEFKKDGSICAVTVESFDQDYYDKSELKDMIDEEVKAYGSGVSVDSFSVDNKTAKLTMTYDSVNDYAKFNDAVIFYGTLSEANAQGFDLTSLDGQASALESFRIFNQAQIPAYSSKTVIYVTDNVEILFPGEALFSTPNVNVSSGAAEPDGTVSTVEPAILILQ